jgi:hypothetical protein
MAAADLSSIARSVAGASGARFELQTAVLPPLGVDLAALASGGGSPPASVGPNPAAGLVAWLIRPTLVGSVGGVERRYPLTAAGAAPQSALAQAVLPTLAAVEVGLALYGAYKVGQLLFGRSRR